MAADEDKWAIEKLNVSNWSTWKFQMKHILLAKELWGLVDGTEAEPGEDTAACILADYRKWSQKAFSVIALAISSSQLYLVTSCEQPRQALEALRNHFECDTLVNKQTSSEEAVLSIGDKGKYLGREASQEHERVDGTASSDWCSYR